MNAPSYRQAQASVARLSGATLGNTTLWRITGAVGEEMLAVLEGEEAVSNAPLEVEEEPGQERVAAFDPVVGERVSVSLDGTTVLVREDGWKEVKGISVSVIEPGPADEPGVAGEPTTAAEPPEPAIHLTRHSYRMRLADADAFALVQGAEADRRRVQYARDLEVVNDGGPWCWRLTCDYYPEAIEILDWAHAAGHIKVVAEAAFGEGSARATAWYEQGKAALWEGEVETLLGKHWQEVPRRQRERGKTIRNGRAYLREHRERMRYPDFRAQGYAIGSGTIESACKNVVGWRMKRGGARWARDRVNPMLALLGEENSGRWIETWGRIQELKCA